MGQKNLYGLALIALVAVATLAACKKDADDTTPAPTPTPTPNAPVFAQLFADNIADATQTFTLNAAVGGLLISDRGTQLDFEPGAFTYEDGTPVTGAVAVSLVEALTLGDMIWLNKQTVGNDNGTLKALRTGGAINVYANQGSTPVLITEGGLVAKIPTNDPDPAMELFRGNEDSAGNMIWDRIEDGIITTDSAYYDSTDYTYTFPYVFSYDITGNTDLNWINCDYFYDFPNTTYITPSMPSGMTTDSTAAWLVLPTLSTLLGTYASSQSGFTHWVPVPVGYQAVVVALKQGANGYSSAFVPITVSASMSVPMTFSPTTLEEFNAAVDAL